MASAQSEPIPDGIYLVLRSEQDESIWAPIHGALNHREPLQRERLMSLEIASAEAIFDENWGAPIILVTLAESLREQFAKVTEEHKDQQLALVVDGVIVMAPHTPEPIRDGEFEILAPGDLESAVVIADALRRAGLN